MFYIEKFSRFTRKDITFMHIGPAVIVFLAFFTITIWSFLDTKNSLQNEQQQQLNRNITTTQDSVEKRVGNYEDLLNAGSALFEASESVTGDEWKNFIDIFDLPNRFSGVKSIGVAQNSAGGAASNVIYIQPDNVANPTSINHDFYSNPRTAAVMHEARDTGIATITDRDNFNLDPQDNNQPTLLMFLPIYERNAQTVTVEQRRENLKGFLFVQFYTDALISESVDNSEENFAFLINDKTNDQTFRLYQTSNFNMLEQVKGRQVSTRDFRVDNRVWEITGKVSPEVISARERGRATTILWGGILLSLFLAGFIYLLLVNRSRALMNKEEGQIQSAKDELLALASHQLRTPATGVKQYIGMLKEGFAGKLTPQQKEFVNKAYESNERQLGTINEMLVVAQADAGTIKLSFNKVDLTILIQDIIKEQSQQIKNRNQKLHKIIPRKHLYIEADSQYIRMAIENILNNAIKYTPAEGHITITLNKLIKNVEIAISDTGVGVSKKNHRLLFRKFSRIPNELTRQVSGTGIGLYLAKKIVDSHNGKIEFESIEGQGSTCKIKLPIKRVKRITEGFL